MRVFISWSGRLSKGVAEALHEWLPLVIQSIDPWISTQDISKGERWFSDVGKELEEQMVGIFCLTRSNVAAPWLHFEAGAISKAQDASRVMTLLIDVDRSSDIPPPLGQFQATMFEKEDMLKLLKSLNDKLGKESLKEARLEQTFERFWDDLNKRVTELVDQHASTDDDAPHRTEREVLDEILVAVRSIERNSAPLLAKELFAAGIRYGLSGTPSAAGLELTSGRFWDPSLNVQTGELVWSARQLQRILAHGDILAVPYEIDESENEEETDDE